MRTVITCREAIVHANSFKNHVVGWDKKHKTWVIYDAKEGCDSSNIEPLFLCLKNGVIPIALNEEAQEIWISLIKEVQRERGMRVYEPDDGGIC